MELDGGKNHDRTIFYYLLKRKHTKMKSTGRISEANK